MGQVEDAMIGDAGGHEPPAGEAEITEFLIPIWAFLFENGEVGRDSDFFLLGGRSLHMAVVANHLRDRFGIEVPPLTLVRFPTIATLSRHLGAAATDEWL